MRRVTRPRSAGGYPGNQVDAVPGISQHPELLDGRYTLGEVLGSGGSATVYRAQDVSTGSEIAVKLFHSDLSESEQYRHRQELRTFRELRHPGLVALYGGGTYQGRTYLVMPLVTGPTLAERLARGPLSPAETMRIGAQLGGALAYLHDAGITHRDIKPANVLLGQDGAKLSDFGIARYCDASQVTATGDVVGTAAYMAPEQVRSVPVGPKADIFALGLVLLECLTGIREYPGSIVESAVARLHRRPVVPEGLPERFSDLLRKMTRQRPDSRPAAAQIAAVLDVTERSDPLPNRQIHAWWWPLHKYGRRVFAMLGTPAAALAAVVLAAGALSGGDQPRETHRPQSPPRPASSASPSHPRPPPSAALVTPPPGHVDNAPRQRPGHS